MNVGLIYGFRFSSAVAAISFVIHYVEQTIPDSMSSVNTILLGGVVALLAWSLITSNQTRNKVNKVVMALEGWDGKTGMISELNSLKRKDLEQSEKILKLRSKVNRLVRALRAHSIDITTDDDDE